MSQVGLTRLPREPASRCAASGGKPTRQAGPEPPDDAAWKESIAAFLRSRERMKAIARDVDDLTAKVPTGKGHQTYLRAILLVADHAAYHVGQLIAVRRALGIWG